MIKKKQTPMSTVEKTNYNKSDEKEQIRQIFSVDPEQKYIGSNKKLNNLNDGINGVTILNSIENNYILTPRGIKLNTS